MTISAATLEKLMVAGLTGEALLSVVRSIENDMAPSAADVARQRKNEADRNRMAQRRATVALQSRDTDVKKEIPHTPLEKTNIINYISAREAVAKPAVSRGTRLLENFLPLPNVIELARNLGFSDTEIKFEIAQFTDHWRAASGANAVKRDWQAALRNWFRNALKFKKSSPSRKSTGDKWRDGIDTAERVSRGEGILADQELS